MTVKIRALVKADDRSSFDCGEPTLNRYIREQVSQDVRRRLNKCFVAIDAETGRVAGFYTLSASSISLQDLPVESARKLSRYPLLPVALIGRLAVDLSYRETGLGSRLLGNAIERILSADIGAFAVIVDAKSDAAATFYRRYGFMDFVSSAQRLFLTIGTAKKI